MKLSRKSHQQLECFFREYFIDEKLTLPDFELYAKKVSSLITQMLKIHGITLGRNVFIKPEILNRNADRQLSIPKDLLAHEATHVLQYQKLGRFRFLYTYLKGYWNALKVKEKWDFDSRRDAYLEIPHEIEARECAAKFLEWVKKKDDGKRKMDN